MAKGAIPTAALYKPTITPKSRKGKGNMVTMNISDLLELIHLSATNFLNIADRLNEEVTAYINGSHEASHEAAYHMVMDANSIFIQLYNMYYNENRTPSLDYDLAESFIL